VVTEYAVSKYHIQTQLSGWLIQTRAPLTAAQLSAVRQFGHANEVQVQTATHNPSLADFTRGAARWLCSSGQGPPPNGWWRW
jgi:hypothetical protein